MGIISVENMDRLYWLGRYTERVYTTVRIFEEHFDSMIDLDENSYKNYCKRQEIPDIYKSKDDFAQRYCFDKDDPNSIFSNLMRAYDNAVVLREEIGSETLAYIQLAVYAMNKAKTSDAPLIPLMKVKDDIVAFWGIADDAIDSEYVRNILKTGKRIERIDMYGRMHEKAAELVKEVHRLTGRIDRTGLNYNHAMLMKLNYYCEIEELNYKKIVETVEAIV